MTESVKAQIKELIAGLREQKNLAENKLEQALQQRENIQGMPVPRVDVKRGFADAVNESARQFEETLKVIIYRRARSRDAIGVSKSPDVIRELGNYNQLNIDAINYFFGDIIKSKLNTYVDEMVYFDVNDGMPDDEFETELDKANADIEQLKADRDALAKELESILR